VRLSRSRAARALASISSASSRFSVVRITPRKCRFLHFRRVKHFWAPAASPMAPASVGCSPTGGRWESGRRPAGDGGAAEAGAGRDLSGGACPTSGL
jgi:hypothetical protein